MLASGRGFAFAKQGNKMRRLRRRTKEGRGQRYGFININDMYNNDVGKGGAPGCEAYEVKSRIHSLGNYCLPPAGVLHSQNKVIKCAAYGVAQGRGWRYGWMGGWRTGWI